MGGRAAAIRPKLIDIRRHNQIIGYLQTLADGYNEQLGLYKDAEAQREQKLLETRVRLVGG